MIGLYEKPNEKAKIKLLNPKERLDLDKRAQESQKCINELFEDIHIQRREREKIFIEKYGLNEVYGENKKINNN